MLCEGTAERDLGIGQTRGGAGGDREVGGKV